MTSLLAIVLLQAAVASGPADGDEREVSMRALRELPVSSIELQMEGGPVPEGARGLVAIEPGHPYSPRAVRRAIKQLFALGSFSDIKVYAEPAPEGVELTFSLFPVVEVDAIEIAGIESAPPALRNLEDELVEASRLRTGDVLDVTELPAAASRLEEKIESEGFLWAEVEPEARLAPPSSTVVFHVTPGARARIGNVTIEGALAHIEYNVRRELDLSEGALYSRIELQEDLESVVAEWKKNYYYAATLELSEHPRPDARVDLHLLASLGPRVRIEYEGASLKDKTFRSLVPLFEEASLTEDLIEESRANLARHLRDEGYIDAQVSVERESERDQQYLTLRFVMEPGLRFQVASVAVAGLSSIPDEVGALLVTTPRGRFRPQPFRRGVWEDDLKEVRTYFERQGFHAASVRGIERPAMDREGFLDLTIEIEEGPRASVEAVAVEGAEQLGTFQVLEAGRIEPGVAFDRSEIIAARERIINLYRNEGFQEVQVESQTRLDETRTAADIAFIVDEGTRTRVGQIIISGLDVTKDSTVRRLLAFSSGKPLSPSSVLETRQRLLGTGIFRDVDIEALTADPVTQTSDVLVQLEEGPRTTFGYGFGYNERELVRGNVEVTRRNLLGSNRTISTFLRASFRGGRFITTYRQPEFFGKQYPIFVSAYAEQEDRTGFDFTRLGVGAQVSKRISDNQTLVFRYRFAQTDVENLEVPIEDIDRRFREIFLSTVSVASVVDTRDDPIQPTRGQFRILDLEWSAKVLGTRSPYLRGLAQQFFYFPLPERMVAVVAMRLGLGETFGEASELPITERFFGGGSTTLRGFALDQASPKSDLGNPVGGNVLSLLNLELRFPIFGDVRGSVFSDNGNVYRRIQAIQLLNWRYNAGIGFRYETPIGPLRVDYGWKLDRRPNETAGQLHITLGHAF